MLICYCILDFQEQLKTMRDFSSSMDISIPNFKQVNFVELEKEELEINIPNIFIYRAVCTLA
jgi:hypothetical protein